MTYILVIFLQSGRVTKKTVVRMSFSFIPDPDIPVAKNLITDQEFFITLPAILIFFYYNSELLKNSRLERAVPEFYA